MGGAVDRNLALYQFAAALAAANDAGIPNLRTALSEAAQLLASAQAANGSWHVDDGGGAPGSPVTWGTTLATYFVRRTLLLEGNHSQAASRAEKYLRTINPRYLVDEAAVLLALPADPAIRTRAVARLAREQTSDGGWGPSAGAPAEVFDTAVAVLALRAAGERQLIARSRQFLIRAQQPYGGWTETTRPSGSQSYAQHISTTAWATLALSATADSERN
jgi:hypothetical protein